MKATLVIMAAGMGSRYGGEKQTDGIGPHGEAIMEYSVYDAVRAGFHKIVFIIKPGMEPTIRALCGDRIETMHTPQGEPVEVAYAVQDFSSIPAFYTIPPERKKPFGTVHAALCARDVVREPFAIINADDYYGVSAYETILQKLLTLKPTGEGAMVGYRLKNTVSDNGTVSRGVCQLDSGSLRKVKETLKIKKYPDGRITDTENPAQEVPLDPESVVSMNFWGFTPWIFEEMEAYFHTFLRELAPEEQKAECLLPVLVDRLITAGRLDVAVLHTDAVWFGVTYQEDRPVVEHGAALAGGAGEHDDMDAVRLEGTAGSGAPVVDQNGAPLGDQGLLKVVFRQGASGAPGVVLDALQRFLVIDQLFPKNLGQDVFGQVVTGGAQAAGGDDDIGPAPGQLHRLPGPLGVVPHHGVPKHVQTQGGQPLGEHLSVGVGDAAQQQLGANRQDLDLMRHKKTTFQSDAADRPAACGKRTTERTACRGDGPPAGASGWDRAGLTG